jgi:hypothetical protein
VAGEGETFLDKFELAERRAERRRAEERPQGEAPAPQQGGGLERFIGPAYEFRDGRVVVKLLDGRVEEVPLREFVRLDPKRLAERLGLQAQLKDVLNWKVEVLQSYFTRQPLRREVRFSQLTALWTRARPVVVEVGGVAEWVDEERDFTVWLARQSYGASAAIIDVDGYVNPRRLSYALVRADESLVGEVVGTAPQDVLRRLARLLEERGVRLERPGGRARGREGEDDELSAKMRLIQELVRNDAVFAPAPTLRSADFLREFDWEEFVEEALAFGAPVDSRLRVVRACHALRGVEGRYLAHAILVGNSGSGKSQFYKIWGQHWDKVTANTLIGYAKGRDEVYPGLIDHAEEPIAVDQVESADRANLARYLFDYMEDGRCSFAAGGVAYEQRGTAPLVFIANPLGTGGEKDFSRTLDVVSANPALGGRIAIIFYFTDLAEVRGRGFELTHAEEERWLWVKALVRAVEDYCRRELRRIWRDPKVQEWLRRPIPGYYEEVKKVVGDLRDERLREFLLTHAAQAAPKIRGAALQAALLFRLKDIALGSYTVDGVLGEAEAWLERIVKLNLASIANIVGDYEGKRELNARARFEALPSYLKAVVAAAETYRRAAFKEHAGRGQVPEELRDFELNRLQVSAEDYGYKYLSRALWLVKERRGAVEELNGVGSLLGLKFTLKEPGGKLWVTVLSWEPARSITVSERMEAEVRNFLQRLWQPAGKAEPQQREPEQVETAPEPGHAGQPSQPASPQQPQPQESQQAQPQQAQPRQAQPLHAAFTGEAPAEPAGQGRIAWAATVAYEALKARRRMKREELVRELAARGFSGEEAEKGIEWLRIRGKVYEVEGELVWSG